MYNMQILCKIKTYLGFDGETGEFLRTRTLELTQNMQE